MKIGTFWRSTAAVALFLLASAAAPGEPVTLLFAGDIMLADGPGQTIAQAYKLEYGDAVVEVHDDAMQPGEKVLLVDDLLATGGTAEAGIRLIERLGGEVVGCAFVIDLPDLGGRRKLEAMGMEVHCLSTFEGH